MESNYPEDPILRSVCSHWITKIEKARKHKAEVFGRDADECQSFFNGPRSWDEMMGGRAGADFTDAMPDVLFKMNVNKAFELVTLFGPALYYQNPVRTVNPRASLAVDPTSFLDPYTAQAYLQQEQLRLAADATRAGVLAAYLNWTPRENRLDVDSRDAIEEALIKGRGCLWTEMMIRPASTVRVACSTFDSVDNLLVDPDATTFESATWIAKRCVHPAWQVERDYGLEPGSLSGNLESQAMQSEVSQSEDAKHDRVRGLTNDLLVYWKIYSKMGIGGRLSGIRKEYRGPLEMFGDNVFLVVAKNIPYPLNLPPSLQNAAGTGGQPPTAVYDAVAWPIPFHAAGKWPVSTLDFHRIPNSPWPMAHLKAGLGELKFLNWMMSFIAGKIRTTCRDFIALRKSLGEEIKTSILEGKDLTLLEIDETHGTIQDIVGFLQHPEMNGDVWKVIQAVENNFDKRVGLTDLMYGDGGSTQIRSAQEASVRNQAANVRPEDMAKQVEAWMTEVAIKEAIVSRFRLTSADIAPVLGDLAGLAWDNLVHTDDPSTAARELEYDIEAGSGRRPNKDAEVQRTTESVQIVLPILQAYAMSTGDVTPMNNLLGDWAKARDLDPSRYQIQMMPPPMPAAPAEGGGEAPPQAA